MKKSRQTVTYAAVGPMGAPASAEFFERSAAEGAAWALGCQHVRETRTTIIETVNHIKKKAK